MSHAPRTSEDAGSLRRGNFTYFPVIPGRLEFSRELRRAILRDKPRIVAVELPGSLEDVYLQALARLPEMSVIVYPDPQDDERGVYVPVEPCDPFTEAVRTGLEIDAEVVFIEPDSGDRPHLPDTYPDPYSIHYIGIEKYVEAYRVYPQERNEEIAAHAGGMAWKLQGTDPSAEVFVVVSLNLMDPLLDAMEVPQDAPSRRQPPEIRLLNPHPDCLAEITVEYPYLQDRYEGFRKLMYPEERVDRPKVQFDLLRDAEKEYVKNTGDKIEYWQRRMMARFTRNLASINGDLVAGVFDLTVAARSVVDDNYAYEVWQMANRYSPQKSASDLLETVNLSGEEIWLNTKKLRLRRRLPRPKQRLVPRTLKQRKKEKFEGEWAQQTDGNAICSYPPEDLVIEDYGRFLKKKAKSMLSEERSRTEPFTTSILDGIDLRETIRNWHEGKIYVRQLDRIAGEVGAVVMIFDEDREDRYQYLTTWLGEHQNESDMAFYSTYPFEHLVGPGIGRAEYGGYLMTLPPRRMMDVWSDADYDFAQTKPERLLLAALDYSTQRYVVYVAAKPPRSIFRSIAGHLNRQIVYVPIGALSPTKLKKIRVVHVLDSYERRNEAKEYLW
ncbi:MAG TPA: hypothetical protein VEU96_23815 [Bryobacteraceae bacterium]|nr:hypothetical protein [Bryobacteraceae bacterium]